jgi:hypothetical protein
MVKERVFGGEGGGPEVATDGGAESEANTPLEQVYENYTDDLRAMFGGDDDER